MKLTFYDTETTGFYDPKAAPSAKHQPYLVQLSWITDFDGEVKENDYIIKPENWVIPQKSIDVHGITNERARDEGVPIKVAIKHFLRDYTIADEIVCHNLKFDEAIIDIALVRNYLDMLPVKKKTCTMLGTMEILKIPGRWGGYKWPTLHEAYCFLVNSAGFEGAHNALYDVRACREVYYKMLEQKKGE